MSVTGTPCDTCIWHYGLPDLYRQDLLDERGQEWYPGTFVKDDTTFFRSQETKDMPPLIGATSIFGYVKWLGYPIDESVRTNPLTDEMWTRVETMYKRFLGRCSVECHKKRDCEYAFGVMKYLRETDFYLDNTLDDDFYHSTYGNLVPKDGVYFKCYSVPSGRKSKWSYAIDANYTDGGTNQWHVKFGEQGDHDNKIMFTHIMPRKKNEDYVEKGYCSHCSWSSGIPDTKSIKIIPPSNFGYDHESVGMFFGSVAREKPIFMKQDATAEPIVQHAFVAKLADSTLPYHPLNSPEWKGALEKYKEFLVKCHNQCLFLTGPCYSALVAASLVDPQVVNKEDWEDDIYHFFYNENHECQGKVHHCKQKVVLMKCYHYNHQPGIDKFLKYYTAVDEDYKIQGTRQFNLFDVDYETKDPMGLFSHYWTYKNHHLDKQPCHYCTPCNSCTWGFGLPELARTEVKDEAGHFWQPSTFANDRYVLMKSFYTRGMTTLVPAVNIFQAAGYQNYSIGEEVRSKPFDDVSWTKLESMYKKYLRVCSYECYKSHECKYAFGVMKYISASNMSHSYESYLEDDIIKDKTYGEPDKGVFFKCYGVTNPDKHPQYDLDMNYKEHGTYQWKAATTDDQMLFTHVWSKTPNYEFNGYCPDCRWRLGLTDDSFEERDGWKLGTLARDKPIFEKQASTYDAIQLLDWESPSECNTTRDIEYTSYKTTWAQQDGSERWESMRNYIYEFRERCKESCKSNTSCAGVNAVAAYITYDVYNDDKYEQDIRDMWQWKPGKSHMPLVAFKCYGYTEDKEVNYLTAIDKDYKIHGTRQFKTLGGEYGPDLRVAYSHYWSKSNFVVTRCNTCAWQNGIPSFFRNEVSDERGQKWSLGTFDKTSMLLFQSPFTEEFKSTIDPVSIFRYTIWLQNNVDSSILIKPHDDKMWGRLQNMYQRFLGRCSQKCHEIGIANCEYSFAVLKYITDEQINNPNVKLDDDIASIKGGAAVYFKCYSVPKQNKLTGELLGDNPPYQVEFKQVRDAYVWQAKDGASDREMLSTHYWKNEESYTPDGHCDHCNWQYGLPQSAAYSYDEFPRSNRDHPEWRTGTLAVEKPAFLKQNSTKNTFTLDGPLTMADADMRYRPFNVDPFDAMWDRMWTLYYTPRLVDCKAYCALRDECAGAWAVVGLLDADQVNDTWDEDIYDKYHGHGDHLVYKCYGYTKETEKYLTYVDTTYEVDGTRQFHVPESTYQNDYKVLYSHYWSKSGHSNQKPGYTWYTD